MKRSSEPHVARSLLLVFTFYGLLDMAGAANANTCIETTGLEINGGYSWRVGPKPGEGGTVNFGGCLPAGGQRTDL